MTTCICPLCSFSSQITFTAGLGPYVARLRGLPTVVQLWIPHCGRIFLVSWIQDALVLALIPPYPCRGIGPHLSARLLRSPDNLNSFWDHPADCPRPRGQSCLSNNAAYRHVGLVALKIGRLWPP